MKPSPKLTRSRKQKKNARDKNNLQQERPKENSPIPSSSKVKSHKRRRDDEKAAVPIPPSAKKRKKKNLTTGFGESSSGSSSGEDIGSGSSQGANTCEDQHSENLFPIDPNNEIESLSNFRKYLKVNRKFYYSLRFCNGFSNLI